MAYLITPTLYSQYYWFLQTEKSKEEFLSFLRKEPQPRTEAIQRGIDFENDVHAACDGTIPLDPCVAETANIVKGGLWQVKLSKRLDDFLLYGVADVIKRDTIYDIKRTSSYEIGKYFDSIQHDLYMECAEIDRFEYLACDGNCVYREEYRRTEQSRNTLKARIYDAFNWIVQDRDFYQAYKENWTAKE